MKINKLKFYLDFFLILPKNSEYTDNLIFNEQRMMTPYDIYGTFIDIIYSEFEEKNIQKVL